MIPNLYPFFKKVIQDASRSLNKKQLLSHRDKSGVLFQLTLILISMIQDQLINVIISFTSLSTIIIRIITIQFLSSYLQAHLYLQIMYECNLSRCGQDYKYGICYGIYYMLTKTKE